MIDIETGRLANPYRAELPASARGRGRRRARRLLSGTLIAGSVLGASALTTSGAHAATADGATEPSRYGARGVDLNYTYYDVTERTASRGDGVR